MGKRLFEFAKELGLPSKDILDRCKKLGFAVPSQLTVVDEKIQSEIRRDLGLADLVQAAASVAASQPAPSPAKPAALKTPATSGSAAAPTMRTILKPNSLSAPTATYPAPTKGPKPMAPRPTAPRRAPGPKAMPPRKSGHGLAAGRPISVTASKSQATEEKPQVEALNPDGTPAEPKVLTQIKISEGITVAELAQKLNVKAGVLIKELLDLKILATINQRLDMTVAETLASAHDAQVEVVPLYGAEMFQETPDDPKDLKPRSPVVTIMGHVDHGKTLLLDAIRKTKVAEGEAGGITQHIGAYQVKHEKGTITFLDTPGHEAFTMMRARGAKATDIVVLVVAADDGVMPQTLEAIDHAKEAKVPIIVAINKIDKPEANPERVKTQVAERGLVPEDWGGTTIYVEVSAKKRLNLEKLLEMILLQAEVLELKANPNRPAKGVVLEARLDKGRGPVATFLVEKGTLQVGENILAGSTYGRVKAMHDDLGHIVKAAGPATPVEVLGLTDVPHAGDVFYVVEDAKVAREISGRRTEAQKDNRLVGAMKHITLDNLFEQIKEGQIKELKVIVKADVQGSVEALTSSLEKLSTEKVALRVIHKGTGNIVNSDILLASASNAIVVGFNVKMDSNGKATAEKEDVDVRAYKIIYDAVEDVRKAMEGLLEPTYRQVSIGKAEVRQLFNTPKGIIAGCMVTSGKITSKCKVKVTRNDEQVYEGALTSLRRFKDDVKEVANNYECGIGIEGFEDLQVGDQLEAYTLEAVAQKLVD
ncbi:MAG TPA: translation initiation factor IF-2 [bacterium]|nr:translation initiation factor IF-2 [bacterium]